MTIITSEEKDNLFKLIRGAATIEDVSELLRSKNLHHSAGSWTDLFEKWINPYLESREITIADLIDLLRRTEECGRQHLLLYKISAENAANLMRRELVEEKLRARDDDWIDVLQTPKFLTIPDSQTLVDLRWENSNNLFIAKSVTSRISRRFVRDESVKFCPKA